MSTSKGLDWLRSVTAGSLHCLRVFAEPSPVTRNPGRGVIYHGKLYLDFYAECQRQIAQQFTAEDVFADVPLALHCEIIRAKPRTTKLLLPAGDWDNLAKGPTDAITKTHLWPDDYWVEQALVEKRYAQPGEEPGVIMHIGVMK